MTRLSGLAFVVVFGLATAWAQAPATQSSTAGTSAAPAATQNTSTAAGHETVSGCMTQWFGTFTVDDTATGKKWNIKGNGAKLWDDENHTVTVQGISDPNAPSPVLYAQSIQAGQPCGNAAAANSTGAATTGTPAAGTSPAGTTPSGTTTTTPNSSTTPNSNTTTTPSTASPQAGQQPEGGTTQNPSSTAQPATPQAAANGTGSMTQTSSTEKENKGTLAAGTPQTAVASNSTSAAADQNAIFDGCLIGSINNYELKSNGKTYHLQGNTLNLTSMLKHKVEVTGEDFNGKAIQVNGARDLGGNCK